MLSAPLVTGHGPGAGSPPASPAEMVCLLPRNPPENPKRLSHRCLSTCKYACVFVFFPIKSVACSKRLPSWRTFTADRNTHAVLCGKVRLRNQDKESNVSHRHYQDPVQTTTHIFLVTFPDSIHLTPCNYGRDLICRPAAHGIPGPGIPCSGILADFSVGIVTDTAKPVNEPL